MNFINSVTSGINMHFNFSPNNTVINNVQQNQNYNENYDSYDEENEEHEEIEEIEEQEEYEENDDNQNEMNIFLKKREQFILELDEFQFKHLNKFTGLKEDKCAICLLKYKGVDMIKEFPCKHIFHKKCILKWLQKSNQCPMCKYDISKDVNKITLNKEDESD